MWLSGVLSPQEADKSDILLYTLWIHIPNLRRSLDPPGAYINSLRPHLLRFGMWIHRDYTSHHFVSGRTTHSHSIHTEEARNNDVQFIWVVTLLMIVLLPSKS